MQVFNHITFSLSENDLKMVQAIPPGGNWQNIPIDIPSKRLSKIYAWRNISKKVYTFKKRIIL